MNNPFEPTINALSDTWLQIKTQPYLYLLLWLFLSLAPVAILTQILSQPMGNALTEFLNRIQFLDSEIATPLSFPPDIMEVLLKIIGIYCVIWGIVMLVNVYYGAVLTHTISRFRQQELPLLGESLRGGISRFPGFLKSVLFAAWLILWKPATVMFIGSFLGEILQQGVWSSLGLFIGGFFVFAGIYRYGLAPFIHLSLGLGHKEACLLSRKFYSEYRRIIASLFLLLLILPLLAFLLLFSLLMRAGIYLGLGGVALWILQSLYQFTVIMVATNFTMNSISTR